MLQKQWASCVACKNGAVGPVFSAPNWCAGGRFVAAYAVVFLIVIYQLVTALITEVRFLSPLKPWQALKP